MKGIVAMKLQKILGLASLLLVVALTGCQGMGLGGCPSGNCGLAKAPFTHGAAGPTSHASPRPTAPLMGGSGTR